MNICMVEPANKTDTGSIGAYFVADAARKAGHTVDVIEYNSSIQRYDVELVSLHHPSDYINFADMSKHGRIRVVGGHITYNNPRPVIPFADYMCMGDGEKWIVEFLNCLEAGCAPEDTVPGTLNCSKHVSGSSLPQLRYEKKLCNSPYLNRAGTKSAAWYIEIARGCPFSCAYCELGNSMPYRFRPTEEVIRMIDELDLRKTKKIVLFAPDEASHPGYAEILDKVESIGCRQRFGSYRIDQVLRTGGLQVDSNQLVRVGIDGMTEKTRSRVGKDLTNKQIINYFKLMISSGHVNFKIFQMFAHPWESISDFDEWEQFMQKLIRLPLKKNVSLRIKWTPLIPQPATPLAEAKAIYSSKMVKRIKKWHELMAKPARTPGWFISIDGIMSKQSHAMQMRLTKGCENLMNEW